MNTEIYSFKDYRDLLRKMLLDMKKNHGKEFSFQSMADACCVQKSYLSNVLLGRGDLSSDQIFAACEYLSLSNIQSDYVLALSEWQKSSHKPRKSELLKKIQKMKSEGRSISNNLHLCQKTNDDWFALDIYSQMIRMFLTVSRFQKRPEMILDYINLSRTRFIKKISIMEHHGIIKRDHKILKSVEPIHSHIGRESPLYSKFFQQRIHAGLSLADQGSDEDIQFSVLFSADKKSYEKITNDFLDVIKKAENTVNDTHSEHVYLINLQTHQVTN